jgi:hypothetical protein
MSLSISTIFTLIIVLLVIGLLVWLAFYILQQFPLPDPIGRIIRVIVVVLAVLVLIVFLLNIAGVGPGIKVSSLIQLRG